MAAGAVTFGQIATETQRLSSVHARLLAVWLILIAAVYCGLDWATDAYERSTGEEANITPSVIIGIAIAVLGQFHITEKMLADRRPAAAEPPLRGYGAMFGMQFASTLAIVAGLIVFVVPGLYLAGRWLTAGPRLVEDQLTGIESLRASWADSEPSKLAFVLASLISLLTLLVSIGFGVAIIDARFEGTGIILIGLLNLVSALSSVFGWTIAVAAHRCAVPANSGLDEVFS